MAEAVVMTREGGDRENTSISSIFCNFLRVDFLIMQKWRMFAVGKRLGDIHGLTCRL